MVSFSKRRKIFQLRLLSEVYPLTLTHCILDTAKNELANSADPDQMLLNAASDQGLHHLQIVWPFSLEMYFIA